ncbi:MAG TPA: signal peptidase II [Eubacteriaceae bacterium]|nr:signal peptidase II [Eubacteriaceae bacterium]
MIFFAIISLTIIIDQIAKNLAIKYLQPIGTYPLIEDFFHLTYAENIGAAFSILQGKQVFLVATTIVFTTILLYYLIKTKTKKSTLLFKTSLSLIIGGAIGNLIDRINLSYVIDFFDFRYINFAIFNTADSFVVVGTILLAYAIIFGKTDNIF